MDILEKYTQQKTVMGWPRNAPFMLMHNVAEI